MPHSTHNIVINSPQPIFPADIINRLSALENVRMSQMADVQQARSIVQPMATMTPTANKPIGSTIDTPIFSPFAPNTNNYEEETLRNIEKNRKSLVDGVDEVRKMSEGLFTTPTQQQKQIDDAMNDDPLMTPSMKNIIDRMGGIAFNPVFEKEYNLRPRTEPIFYGEGKRPREAFNAFREKHRTLKAERNDADSED